MCFSNVLSGLLLLSFSFSGALAQQNNLFSSNKSGLVTSHKLFFQSYSAQNFRAGYLNEVSVSDEANLLTYLFRKRICEELELLDYQLASVEKLKKRHQEIHAELNEHLAKSLEAEQNDDLIKLDLKQWVDEQAKSSEADLDFLLSHQKDLLKKSA